MRIRGVFLMCCVLFGLVLCGCDYNTQTPVDDRKDISYMRGMDQLARKDYGGAMDSFKRALTSNPNNAAAHYELGLLNEEHKRNYIAAIYHYQEYLALQKDTTDTLIAARITSCLRELVSSSDIFPTIPDHQRQIEKLLAEKQTLVTEKQTLEGSVNKLTIAYEQLRQTYTELVAYSKQLETLLRQTQGTANVAPAPAPTQAPIATTPGLPAQMRTIPSAPPAVETGLIREYAIQEGDTFQKIARNLGIKDTEIIALNPNVNPRKLQIGQIIKVPIK